MSPDHWKESIDQAFEMFKEAGVQLEMVDAVLNGPKIRFNGKYWEP